MSYTLINGAAINAGMSAGLQGIELVTAGQPTATGALAVAGLVALEMGDTSAGTVTPLVGIELVSTGAGTALVYNMAIDLDGIDLVTAGPTIFKMAISRPGVVALEMGDTQAINGTDMAIGLTGIELARHPFHGFQVGAVVPGNATLLAPSYRPLEVGDIEASLGPITITAGGAHALEMGDIGPVSIGLQAAGAVALEMGDLGPVRLGLLAQGATALEMGDITSRLAIPLDGIALGRHGLHSVALARLTLQAGGIHALEMGDLGNPTVSIRARQHFALEMGDITVDRGNAC